MSSFLETDCADHKIICRTGTDAMNPYRQYMYSYPHKTAYRTLTGVRLEMYASCLSGAGHGLYLHLPFCRTKCGYCNLFSVTGQDHTQIDRYLEAAERQSGQYEQILAPYGSRFSEVVIGGGTPLLLEEEQLERMFRMLERHFSYTDERELVIETSPGETSRTKLEILKQAGVTRVSMGIQSFSDEELHTLKRKHSAQKARKALALMKEYAFPCVNVDFIYGIPGQTADSVLNSLKEAVAFEPEEIFLYPLYIKHGAGLQKEMKKGMVLQPGEALLQYREASAYLRAEGFRQDSMRRFVRSTQGRKYTECSLGTSLALGCGGRSYLGNLHYCSPYTITREGCLAQLDRFIHMEDFAQITHGIVLSEEELKRRYVIRHLLIRPGLCLSGYRELFGTCVEEDFPILKDWKIKGYVCTDDTFLTLTETGLELSDDLGPRLISREISEKMEEWEHRNGQI